MIFLRYLIPKFPSLLQTLIMHPAFNLLPYKICNASSRNPSSILRFDSDLLTLGTLTGLNPYKRKLDLWLMLDAVIAIDCFLLCVLRLILSDQMPSQSCSFYVLLTKLACTLVLKPFSFYLSLNNQSKFKS